MLNIFIATLLLVFVGGQILRIELGNGVSINGLDAVIVIVSGLLCLSVVVKKRIHVLTDLPLFKPFIVFIALCLLSLAVNLFLYSPQELFVALLYTIRLLSYGVFIAWVFTMSKRTKKQFASGLFVAGIAILILGFVQYIFYPYLGNLQYLGWDDHLYRLFSVFLDPNFAGCFFVLFSLFTVSKAISEQSRIQRTVYLLTSVLSILAVFLTHSRSAFLVLLLGVVIIGTRYVSRRILASIIVLFAVLYLLLADFSVEGKNPLRIASTSERIQSMGNAVYIFQKQPIFGIGFNAYRFAQNKYGLRTSEKWLVSHADAGTDNSYLFILATTGVVGFCGFIYFMKRTLEKCYRFSKRKTIFGMYALSATLVLLVDSLFINALFYPMLLFFVGTSIAVTEQE